ncbi:hypothetical protein LIER_09759 [Lithospermum erythrorhizon]|uniref:Uncharacterized protein n=1 Tax=Lithospermum erythrorhizon TaxID=34254 RepID=A0AAV3PLS9_LITER
MRSTAGVGWGGSRLPLLPLLLPLPQVTELGPGPRAVHEAASASLANGHSGLHQRAIGLAEELSLEHAKVDALEKKLQELHPQCDNPFRMSIIWG